MLALAVGLAATLGCAVAFSQGGAPPQQAPAPCVRTSGAFVTGGATFTYCAADASTACLTLAGKDKDLATQCDHEHIPRER